MPSEERVFEILAKPLEAFRSALASTIETLRASLAEDEADAARGASPSGADLGAFAAGRIDVDRFDAIVAREAVAVEPDAKARTREAYEVLTLLAARKTGLFRVNVELGASLTLTVAGALAEIGRAFGAARVVDLTRTGRYREEEHRGWLQAYPFARWNAAERSIAPTLVVFVDGEDLKADGLAEFLDGSVKIVLVVRGEAPPAPLARLATPGVFVTQTRDEPDLLRLAAWRGTGIAALVGEKAAVFVHDPDAGSTPRERLTVSSLPTDASPRRLGGLSAWQQEEAVEHLRSMTSAGAIVGDDGETPADPVDKLAAWLLAQADLSGIQ